MEYPTHTTFDSRFRKKKNILFKKLDGDVDYLGMLGRPCFIRILNLKKSQTLTHQISSGVATSK